MHFTIRNGRGQVVGLYPLLPERMTVDRESVDGYLTCIVRTVPTFCSRPNDEVQFLESRKFQVNEICRIYRVPPHMVGDLEHATFSNIEHFDVYTIPPWLVRIEQAMNRSLIAECEKGDVFVQFNLDGLMCGPYRKRMQGYAIPIKPPIRSRAMSAYVAPSILNT